MKIMCYLVKLNIFAIFLGQNLMLFSCGKSGTQLATCPLLRFEESWLFRQRFRTTRIAAQPFMCQYPASLDRVAAVGFCQRSRWADSEWLNFGRIYVHCCRSDMVWPLETTAVAQDVAAFLRVEGEPGPKCPRCRSYFPVGGWSLIHFNPFVSGISYLSSI